MPKIDVYDINGKKVKELELNEAVFGIEPNEAVVHSVLVNFLANQRQGTQSTKTRSEVSGGGRKPWRQKGTGRARQGSTRSPQWPGGGIVFGPKPRSYDKKMNRKERRLALKSALAYKTIDKELIVLDNFNLADGKTKTAIEVMNNLKIKDQKTLIVVDKLDDNMILATRNLANVMLEEAKEINTLDVVAADNMVVTEAAVAQIEEVLI